jgi:hypothetical protein
MPAGSDAASGSRVQASLVGFGPDELVRKMVGSLDIKAGAGDLAGIPVRLLPSLDDTLASFHVALDRERLLAATSLSALSAVARLAPRARRPDDSRWQVASLGFCTAKESNLEAPLFALRPLLGLSREEAAMLAQFIRQQGNLELEVALAGDGLHLHARLGGLGGR